MSQSSLFRERFKGHHCDSMLPFKNTGLLKIRSTVPLTHLYEGCSDSLPETKGADETYSGEVKESNLDRARY